MEGILTTLHEGFEFGQLKVDESELRFKNAEKSLQAYLTKAKNTLTSRQILNPNPAKRFMRTIPDESESDEEKDDDELSKVNGSVVKVPAAKKYSKDLQKTSSLENTNESSNDLRPIRSAKSKANLNLKEIPLGAKMRNDMNEVVIKKEPSRSLRSSCESIKENKTPANGESEKRKSPDEGIQSAVESEVGSARSSKRSNSVEVISKKLVEIDLTANETSLEAMPPPKVAVKKTRTKQKQPTPVIETESTGEVRITRSKIKQEKLSIPAKSSEITIPKKVEPELSVLQADPLQKSKVLLTANESVASKKAKKKYPLPMLIKVEPEEMAAFRVGSTKKSQPEKVEQPLVQPERAQSSEAQDQICNDTFNVPPAMNTTVNVATVADTTVTLTRNVHDSLMTEDNDEEADVSMEVLPPPLPPKKQPLPVSALKLKKNEVFNPYLSSPVKQRVQAFEKHAVQATPDKYNTLPPKYGSLKTATPSKIAYYSAKTTPLSMNHNQKFTSASTSNLVGSSSKTAKPLKKGNSLSQEALDEYKKASQAHQLLEEKRKAREEKQRLAALHREAMEKEKREQALRVQQEREEKYRKIMREKEEKSKMDALKKKVAKEKQARKYAEEKTRSEFVQPKAVEPPGGLSKNDSLHLKMQKQLLLDRSLQKVKEDSKNTYSFDMLHTDDSTDDESRPSAKRPPPPEWSKKKTRKPLIAMQTYVNPSVLDCFFSSKPINVDLREIFPAIDSKKLVRNSSAIWRTPPKQN